MNGIAHNNKDLVSKILADTFGHKSFAVYGIDLPPIVQCLPTEFPEVQVTDRISDRLFLLQDGSYALVDFESKYLLMNKVKYLRYITRILDHYLQNYLDRPEDFHLRLIVLYTGNVKSAHADFSTDCLTIRTEQAFLSHIDGDAEFRSIVRKLDSGETLDDEDLMRLIILPLTYDKSADQIRMVDRAIDSAARIREDEKRSFVLAGICIAADQFILQNQIRRIGGLLKMTKVGQLLQEEFDQLQSQIDESRKQLQQQNQQIQQHDQQIRQPDQQIRQQDQQIQQRDQQIQQRDQQIQQRDQQIQQRDQQIQQRDQQIQQRDQQLRKLQDNRAAIVLNLLSEGFSLEKIRLITGLGMDEIKNIMNAAGKTE